MMPAPFIMEDGNINLVAQTPAARQSTDIDILFATDRKKTASGDADKYLSAHRGDAVTVGSVTIHAGSDEKTTWAELADDTLRAKPKQEHRLTLTKLEEFGKLYFTEPPAQFSEEKTPATTMPDRTPARQFALEINKRLDASDRKDVYLFIHGYNTGYPKHFEIAGEIYHFIGRQGVMIAYAWPSQSSVLEYFSDKEASLATVRHFRLLIKFIAQQTRARRIHIIAHSAGNPVVVRALTMLRLKDDELSAQEIREKYRIGNVILAAPDMDLQDYMQAVYDGFYDISDHVTIYMSSFDRALDLAHWIVGEPRLGDAIRTLKPEQTRVLVNVKNADVVDVSSAQLKFPDWLGHGYYHQNPWVSSDIALRLLYDARPAERGLVRDDASRVWRFGEKYPDIAKMLARKLVEKEPTTQP